MRNPPNVRCLVFKINMYNCSNDIQRPSPYFFSLFCCFEGVYVCIWDEKEEDDGDEEAEDEGVVRRRVVCVGMYVLGGGGGWEEVFCVLEIISQGRAVA